MATDKKSALDRLEAAAEEVFDDAGDKQFFVKQANELVNLPWFDEAAEAEMIEGVTDRLLAVYHAQTD